MDREVPLRVAACFGLRVDCLGLHVGADGDANVVTDTLLEGERHTTIQTLIEYKRQGNELVQGPRLSVLDTLIDETLERLESAPKTQVQPQVDMALLDDLFRQTIERYAPREAEQTLNL